MPDEPYITYFINCSSSQRRLDSNTRKSSIFCKFPHPPADALKYASHPENGEVYHKKMGVEWNGSEEMVEEYCGKCVERLKGEGKLGGEVMAYDRKKGKYADIREKGRGLLGSVWEGFKGKGTKDL